MQGWMVEISRPPETSRVCSNHCNKVFAEGKEKEEQGTCIFDVVAKHSSVQFSNNRFRSRSSGTKGALVTVPQTVETEVNI
jgi:hypothetical protein